MRPSSRTLVTLAALLAPVGAMAQQQEMRAIPAAKLQWTDLTAPGFAPGIKLAAVVGDPAAADQPYTVRLKFPDGYRFPAHYHPKAENVTVLTGTFLLGMGKSETGATATYTTGDYLFVPPEMPHFGSVRGETVVQLHGVGPFEIKLVNPPKTTDK
jgi:quercetin dioxygenase-like cupin family protein